MHPMLLNLKCVEFVNFRVHGQNPNSPYCALPPIWVPLQVSKLSIHAHAVYSSLTEQKSTLPLLPGNPFPGTKQYLGDFGMLMLVCRVDMMLSWFSRVMLSFLVFNFTYWTIIKTVYFSIFVCQQNWGMCRDNKLCMPCFTIFAKNI